MSKKILEIGDSNAIISQIVDLYNSQDWGMTEAEFLTQVKKELSKEMEDWIIEARYDDQAEFEMDLPDYVDSVKVYLYQVDFMGNRWVHKPRIQIGKESCYVNETIMRYLREHYDYDPANGDWFEYIPVEGTP